MNNIYQQIWNCDRHKFLVSPRNEAGGWLDPEADILLDEQVKAFGSRDLDLTQKPLFYRVDESKFQQYTTYGKLIALLDNYLFDNQKSEIITRAEKAEIDLFLDNICQTEAIAIAYEYIVKQLKVDFSQTSFKAKLRQIWFELYTNFFGSVPVKDASGFEHVFVGEGKYTRPRADEAKIGGEISGYHSWVKFYLDERQDKANYLGHNYLIEGNIGVDNPYVVTVQMRWRDLDKQTGLPIELFKKRGCFFIGTSPECEMAMGTVAYYESQIGYKFRDEKRAITINGAKYNLALYRNTKADDSRGDYIRSFYPIYLGSSL
ncbi:MAG: hypothetical protein AAFQ41_13385 [Cyanobacteria bacterium J06623_7]